MFFFYQVIFTCRWPMRQFARQSKRRSVTQCKRFQTKQRTRNKFNGNDDSSLSLSCRYFSYDTINEQKCETKVKKQCRTVQEEVLSSLSPFPTRSRASPTFFPNALIPHCRNLSSPTFRFARTFQRRHATQSMSRFWEHRLWFQLKFQHILLATLVLILKLTWLRFHKTVTQDRGYA